MSDSDQSIAREQFELACQGNGSALGKLLEQHRPWLKFLAKRMLNGDLKARIDESDVVQQTCLSVHRNFKNFRGGELREFIAWIKQIHERNLQDMFKHHQQSQMRSVSKEKRYETELELNIMASGLSVSSPSQRLFQSEQAIRLAAALEQLPEAQAEAVRLRYLEGYTLEEVTEQLDRSYGATVALIRRGVFTLKKNLQQE